MQLEGSGKQAAETEGDSKTRLSSVAAAIRLLKVFSDTEVEIGISALAKHLGLAKSTVHRMATTLLDEGMLEQNSTNGRYRLGLAVLEMGALARRSMTLSNEARPFLFDLRTQTNETVMLAVREGFETVMVLALESNHAIRLRSAVGTRQALLGSTLGQAMVSYLPDDRIAALLATAPAAAYGQEAPVAPAQMRDRFETIRNRGYVIEHESEFGMHSIAAPVFGEAGVVGAIGLAGPAQRLPQEVLETLVPSLLEAGRSISLRMGQSRYPLLP